MAPAVPSEWDMPRLRYSLNFEDTKSNAEDANSDTEFFDVKFYPYNPPGSNPVFAAVSKRHTKDTNPCEIIRVIRDEDEGALNCSCTWALDPETERALLCVAGRDAKVKVYNIHDGEAVTSFVGHGGEINDLATSPTNPHLIVSASDDTTVRLWSLDPVHKKQPCVCLLGGEGHSWNLLSVAFHDTGRYVISAGHDQVINLWTLPDIPNEHVEVPIIVHFPHFSTSEIHTGLIDCVAFYGDLILSRACLEDVIVLWRIEGFDSTAEPPSPEQAPSNQDTTKLTRSAFHVPLITSPSAVASANANAVASTTPQYTRLLQLHTPGCGPQFFMRFGLFNVAGHHPMLAFCNASAKIFFWDFTCFSAYRQFMTANYRRERLGARPGGAELDEGPVPRPPWMRIVVPRKRPIGNGGNTNSSGTIGTNNPGGRRLRDAANGPGLLGAVARDGDGSDRESSVVSGAQGVPGAASAATPTATSSTSAGATPKGRSAVGYRLSDLYNQETLDDWNSKYNANDPHVLVKAHKAETTKGLSAVGRQAAWSPEGEWCVVVGSNSRVMILQRWAKSDPSHPVDEAE
ncbi:hypothetical protein HMPREF1624_06095 [Sporothrix schenckii ATCC 58251]|uniref:Uncharacterized protein n=1 Tax=Sporothrix schenckii (strain ATCC 58251 / de Perez 2211183) TaxID=1391915 RepID=U7PT87_SPOS1|nr:hypothetical protein HMPREF1624_06095 [Sporothrix schenckii ATCC 58251]